MDIEVVLDGGAYSTLSPVVLSRGTLHASGPVSLPARADRGPRDVHQHAAQRRVSRLRRAADGVRRRSAHGPDRRGAGPRPGAAAREEPASPRRHDGHRPGAGRRRVAPRSPPHRGAALEATIASARRGRERNKGIGLALFWHGSGFTGSGELKLGSRATVEITATGARVLTSSTEIGQGTRTMHAQIVADALGIPYEDVEVAMPDTAIVPGQRADRRVAHLHGGGEDPGAGRRGDPRNSWATGRRRNTTGSTARSSVTKQYEQPDWIQWDEVNYRGDAYATYAWGCDVAEVEIDPRHLGSPPDPHHRGRRRRARRFTPRSRRARSRAAPRRASATRCSSTWSCRTAAMANAQLTNYLIPTTLDTPRMDVVMLEHPYAGGPFGAKGLGELPIDGPAPAIVNAIRHLGIDVREHSRVAGAAHGGGMRFHLNGQEVSVDVPPMARLLDVLREACALTGTKEGCGEGECGACTVLINRRGRVFLPGSRRAGGRRRASPPSRAWATTIRWRARSWTRSARSAASARRA